MSDADETESEPQETRVVLDPQVLRSVHAGIVVMFVLGAVMIWLGYFRLDRFDYTADDVSSSHRFMAMVLIALAPGALIWRNPRWARVGGWALWSLALFTWGVMRVKHCPTSLCDAWTLDIWPLFAMRLVVVAMFLGFIVLLAIAARGRREHGPSARVVKR